MRYVKNNKIYTLAELRSIYPNMSIPDGADCTKLGYGTLIETLAPSQEGYYAAEKEPINNVQQWELLPYSTEEIKQSYTDAIQNHMDAKAQEKNYDNIVSACSYAGYDNPFRAEGEAYGMWRASCWKYAYEQLALILGGSIEIPTVEAFIQELPLLEV